MGAGWSLRESEAKRWWSGTDVLEDDWSWMENEAKVSDTAETALSWLWCL